MPVVARESNNFLFRTLQSIYVLCITAVRSKKTAFSLFRTLQSISVLCITATKGKTSQLCEPPRISQIAYPQAVLEQVESMRGIEEKRNGRYYLRYRYFGGATEFLGHVNRDLKIDFKKGIVGVLVT